MVSLEAARAGVLSLQGDHHACQGSSLPFLSSGVPAATRRMLNPLFIPCSSSGPCPLSRGEFVHAELKGESSETHRAGRERNTKDSPCVSALSRGDFLSPLYPAGLHCGLQRLGVSASLEKLFQCFVGVQLPASSATQSVTLHRHYRLFLSLPATYSGGSQGSTFHFLLS